tara:strand:- start:408 stop:551 length:144 start_codon:yes stop_codon:yes gene_type:complete
MMLLLFDFFMLYDKKEVMETQTRYATEKALGVYAVYARFGNNDAAVV